MLHQKRLLVNVARRSSTAMRMRKKSSSSLVATPGNRHLSSAVLQEVEEDTPEKVLHKQREALKGMISLREHQKEVNAQKTELKREATQEKCAITSPSHLSYFGQTRMPITSKLHIFTPEEDIPSGIWPVFRLMVSLLWSSHFLLFPLRK